MGNIVLRIVGNRRAIVFIALSVYLLGALVLTYPFIKSPQNTITAPIDGDIGYSAILFEAIKREGLNPFSDGKALSIAYPDGVDINTGVNRVSALSTLFLWLGTLSSSAVIAHSMMSISGYMLTAIVTFCFIRKLLRSNMIGFIAGAIYGFFPLMPHLARSAATYTHMWLFLLPIWAFTNIAIDGISRRRLVLAVLSVLPAMYWTPYYAFHILLVGFACLLGLCFMEYRKQGIRQPLLLGASIGAIWGVFCIIYYFIGMSTPYAEIPQRTMVEAYEQSAHPLMYIMAGTFTVLGQPFHSLLTELVPRAANTSLYMGISCVFLAGFAVFASLRMRISRKLKVIILLATLVCFVAFMFSLAPTVSVLGQKVPTPNYLVSHFVPSLRAGQRLAMPLMAGLVILVAAGLFIVTRNMKLPRKTLMLGIALVIIAVDLASLPPNRTMVIRQSDMLRNFSMQPTGLTAQYNFSSLVSNPGQYICFDQFQHKMPIVNDCAIGRDPYNFDKPTKTLEMLIKLPLCDQLGALQKLGVKYLILQNDDAPIHTCMKQYGLENLLVGTTQSVYKIEGYKL